MCPTRSHLELGRETKLRRWYYRSSDGRVGRRQALQPVCAESKFPRKNPFTTSETRHGADTPRKAERPSELRRGKPRQRTLPPALEADTNVPRGGAVR